MVGPFKDIGSVAHLVECAWRDTHNTKENYALFNSHIKHSQIKNCHNGSALYKTWLANLQEAH